MDHIIILAGGKGTRMKVYYPKVIHKINKIPLISHLLHNVTKICSKPTIIVGHQGERVIHATLNRYHYVWQHEQLGTGHAVMRAKTELENNTDIEDIIVLPGDHPLITTETLQRFIVSHKKSKAVLSVGTILVPHFNYSWSVFFKCGRIQRATEGGLDRIIEFKDASEDEKTIREVAIGYYCFRASWLWENIHLLQADNHAHEYYLTDMIKIAREQNQRIGSFRIKNPLEAMGVNTMEDSLIVENYLRTLYSRSSKSYALEDREY